MHRHGLVPADEETREGPAGSAEATWSAKAPSVVSSTVPTRPSPISCPSASTPQGSSGTVSRRPIRSASAVATPSQATSAFVCALNREMPGPDEPCHDRSLGVGDRQEGGAAKE